MTPTARLTIVLVASIGLIGSLAAQDRGKTEKPVPRVIRLNPSSPDSMDIFTGPPSTYGMHSGYMVLAPTKSVGKHSTRDNEEVLIVLAGHGELRIEGGPALSLAPYEVSYCPPHTEHHVVCSGPDTLRYIWLVARTAGHRGEQTVGR